MFWKKKKHNSFVERSCSIEISSRFNEVLFVPFGKTSEEILVELDKVIIRTWPLNIGEIQNCIKQTLNSFEPQIANRNLKDPTWFSFERSRAKTQRDYEVEYVSLHLITDFLRPYGHEEVERITINASPFDWNKDNYKITGTSHLIETEVAQQVIDIYNACEKIRNA